MLQYLNLQIISHGIDFTINRSDNIIKTSYGNILLRNMSDPKGLSVYEVGYSLIDETDIIKG
jgi:hypothetical protein